MPVFVLKNFVFQTAESQAETQSDWFCAF